MPLYDFVCEKCGHRFEKSVTIAEIRNLEILGYSYIPSCPNCNSVKTRRSISAIPVIYKSEGFTKRVKNDSKSTDID